MGSGLFSPWDGVGEMTLGPPLLPRSCVRWWDSGPLQAPSGGRVRKGGELRQNQLGMRMRTSSERPTWAHRGQMSGTVTSWMLTCAKQLDRSGEPPRPSLCSQTAPESGWDRPSVPCW